MNLYSSQDQHDVSVLLNTQTDWPDKLPCKTWCHYMWFYDSLDKTACYHLSKLIAQKKNNIFWKRHNWSFLRSLYIVPFCLCSLSCTHRATKNTCHCRWMKPHQPIHVNCLGWSGGGGGGLVGGWSVSSKSATAAVLACFNKLELVDGIVYTAVM